MERYLELGAAFLAMVAFVPAFVFLLIAVKNFIQMLSHFRNARDKLTAHANPFQMPFMPQLFTAQGNLHRLGFIANMRWFLCCFIFIGLMYGFLSI